MPTFIGLRRHLVVGQLNKYQFFSAFHWSTSDTPLASQCITVQLPISKTPCGPCWFSDNFAHDSFEMYVVIPH